MRLSDEGSVVVPTGATGAARVVAIPPRTTRTAGRVPTPSRTPGAAGPAPVVVAVPGVPVIAPARVPELPWAPLRERPGLRLSLGGGAQPRQAQTDEDREHRCNETWKSFHGRHPYPAPAAPKQ